MSLLYWLPMTDGTLKNQGLSNVQPTNHEATVNNSGKLGKCYDFAGTTSQYIDTGFKESFGTGDFTITAWFKLTDSGSRTYQPIISNKATAAASVGVAIYYNHSQQKFLWSTADGTSATEIWMANTFSYSSILNTWHHIAMVRNSSDSKIGYFYIDGVRYELASVPPIRNVTNNTNNMFIGSIIAPTTNYMWTGSLCDIRIYDEALSPREIKEISKGLVCHYPLSREGLGQDNLILPPDSSTGYGSLLSERSFSFSGWDKYADYYLANDTINWNDHVGEYLTYRCWMCNNAQSTGTGTGIMLHFFYADSTYQQFGGGKNGQIGQFLAQGESGWLQITVQIPDPTIRTNPTTIANVRVSMRHNSTNGVSTVTIKQAKAEFGQIATPWTPNSADALYSAMGLDDNIVYDVSGYGHNGTASGVVYSADTARYSVSTSFDGVDDYIQLPFNDVVVNGDIFTVNLWFKKESIGSKSYETLLGGPSGFEMDTRAGGTSTLSLYMAGTRGGNMYSPFSLNQWYMVTLVNDGTNELYYVNGQLVKTIEKKNMPTGNYFLGAWQTADKQNYKGFMSDFRIYKTALSAEDILALYQIPISLSNNGTLFAGEYIEG